MTFFALGGRLGQRLGVLVEYWSTVMDNHRLDIQYLRRQWSGLTDKRICHAVQYVCGLHCGGMAYTASVIAIMKHGRFCSSYEQRL
jgi:hypothetical protein